MKHLTHSLGAIPLLLLATFAADCEAAPAPKPPAVPATYEIEVVPAVVLAGQEARVSLHLTAADGVKINRYPKISLKVAAAAGLVAESSISVGNDKAPPPGEMEKNYFKTVDPVELTLAIDGQAAKGLHEIEAKLTYFYCVAASGFCAPKTVPVAIPVRVD